MDKSERDIVQFDEIKTSKIKKKYKSFNVYFTKSFIFSVADEPIWNLERRESSGHLFWCRDSSKVKFRCDVEVLEYVKDPDEHKCYYDNYSQNSTADRITNAVVVCATCVAAIAVTVLLPWFLIGSK